MIKKINYIADRLTLTMWACVSLFFFWGYSQDNSNLRKKLEIRQQFNVAINLYHQESYTLANSYFLDVLKKDSQHFFGRYYLSLSFFRTGKTDEAIREMENLIRIHGLNRNLEKKINFFSKQKFLEIPKRDFSRYVWIRDYPNPEAQASSLGRSLNPFIILRKQGYRLRTPIHLQVSYSQELLVLDFSLKSFFRLDSDGVFLRDIYSKLPLNSNLERLGGPWAFSPLQNSVAENGKFWVTDFINDNIKVIDLNGNVLSVIGSKGIGETNFLGIKGITSDENGNFYIADSGNGRIQFRNQRGEWLKNIGQRGESFGNLLNPIDVAYDQSRRQIYILDKGNKKIVLLSVEGDFIEELLLNTPNNQFPSIFNTPINLQKLYLDNPKNPSYLYLLDAKYLYRLHLSDKQWEKIEISRQQGTSQFISMAMGDDGYLYLGNALREKIEVFAPVEKTYVNLPVLVKSIDTKKFPLVRLDVGVKDLIGHPIKFLQSRNFSLYENNVALPFKLIPKPENQRIILLVEKSTAAQERKFTIKAFMENLFDQMTGEDSVKVITYNQNGHTEQTPPTQFKLAAIEKTLNDNYTEKFIIDSALQAAINHTKKPKVKPAVVILAFTPHEAIHFQKKYINLIQTIKNNDVPVYIFYAGPKTSDSSLFHLQNLSSQTRGQFYFYNKDALSRFKSDFNNYHTGNYTLQYMTSSDPRNRGVFRRVAVDVRYKNSQGEDSLAGYPLP